MLKLPENQEKDIAITYFSDIMQLLYLQYQHNLLCNVRLQIVGIISESRFYLILKSPWLLPFSPEVT